ncbi:MAG: hypothetical protein ACPGXK_12600, partial [Phycisphaerae bacterium]
MNTQTSANRPVRIVAIAFLFLQVLGTACGPESDLLSDKPTAAPGKPMGAKAVSTHYVRIDFDGAIPQEAKQASAYVITSALSEPLEVTSLATGIDGRSVYLATQTQVAIEYAVAIQLSADASREWSTLVFSGVEDGEAYLERAIALSSQEILLTFSQSMDVERLAMLNRYDIEPSLTAVEAVATADGRSVRLRLADEQHMKQDFYAVRVRPSFQGSSPSLIDPTRDRDEFEGIAAEDIIGPSIDSIESQNANTILITFTEPVAERDILPQSFTVDPPLAVVQTELRSFDTQVALITQPQQAGASYRVTVSPEVRDLVGNGIVDAVGEFMFPGQLHLGSTNELPRVVGAVSTGSRSVVVAFNKVMGQGIDNPLYYSIAGSDTAFLTVVEATPSDDRTWVELTTLTQAPDEYTVHVVNVRDMEGNPLAAPDGLLPPPLGFDPTRATFRGTAPVINPEAKLYAIDADSHSLIKIDPFTGQGSIVGPLGIANVRALVFNPTSGQLYGTTFAPSQLVRIDMNTGSANVIGPLGEHDVRGLACDINSNTLYGATINPRELVRINPSTAAVTVVGSLEAHQVWGLTYDANTETLYGSSDLKIMTIDTLTVAVADRGPLGFGSIQAMAFNNRLRAMYGLDRLTSQLVRIDRFTGESEAIGNIGFPNAYGLTVGPSVIDEQLDTDGDGFADWFEELGWFVTIQFDDGTTGTAHVTSDPYSKDTDGDGIWDGDENRHNLDPRTDDTDADQVDDYSEWNIYYTDPRKQDTDDDGISDLFEIEFFKTSPILADTDGDQIPDAVELFERNRNPRIADIPVPQVVVGEIAFSLDERFEYTDETGTTQTEERSSSTTLAQGSERTFATSDVNSGEFTSVTSQATNFEFEWGADKLFGGFTWGIELGFEQTASRGWQFQVDQSSAISSTQEDSKTLTEVMEISQNSAVTRTVEDADLLATVSVRNNSDIAFSIRDLELSVLLNDPFTSRKTPVATLLPQRTLQTGEDLSLNLGPFDGERGPFIFSDVQIFPQEVARLRKAPSAVIVKISNFNIESEDGRSFAFSSQETNDQTAGLVIDFGNGEVESYRVATASTFDEATGRPLGISMRTALEEIIGISKADDVVPQPGLTDASSAYVNDPALRDTYGTVMGTFSTEPGNPNAPTYEVEVLTRVRGIQNGDPNIIDPNSENIPDKKFWALIASPSALPEPGVNFSDTRLYGGRNYTLRYVEDFDKDGLFAYEEWEHKSSDRQVFTDTDSISDYDEVKVGWTVEIGDPYQTRSYPFTADSDNDGVPDDIERAERTDPHKRDTDEDGISDKDELEGYYIRLSDTDSDPNNDPTLYVQRYAGTPSSSDCPIVTPSSATPPGVVCVDHRRNFATDPLNRDTDGDGVSDGKEVVFGSNPNDRGDADTIADADSDGLTDREEIDGWDVTITYVGGGTSVIPACGNAQPGEFCISSNPNSGDSDGDGVPDLLERLLGLAPQVCVKGDPLNCSNTEAGIDTDNDGLTDYEEIDPGNYSSEIAEYTARCLLSPDPVSCPEFMGAADSVGTLPADADT